MPATLLKKIVTKAQLKHMVEQFLRWMLASDFGSGGGISFAPTYRNGTLQGVKHVAVGTNLLTHTHANSMVIIMIDGGPAA